MNQLIVVSFDHFDDARSAIRTLRALEGEERIAFEDTALIERDPDGGIHVKNEVSGTTETAAAVGAVIGGVVGFAFPPAGALLGAGAGAAIGSILDRGVNSRFIDDMKKTLTPGRSALMLVVKEADADAVIAGLRPFRGDVVQSTLPTETEDALKAALE